ncbi:putative thiamine transporter SLC35F3 isoform X3 [Pomacea canaliculata]|uniref:putative thiamine transporter SLC35F3 isoform X3 n=1 Tax=Pomacea canaliculata TaxID=400727 RepID=UPI000D737E60|nr:putative thiamine transporter SLC35F3 isoform X3 [Pomacea canaliculata]
MSSSIPQPSVTEDTDIGASEAGIEMGVATARPIPKANCLASHGRFLSGLVTAMVTGLTWVGLTQIIKEAELQHLLKSPAGLTYFCSGWLMLAFPPYLLMNVLVKHKNMKEVLRESIAVYAGIQGQEARHWPHVWKTALLLFTWALALYTYFEALWRIEAADVTSLYATNHSFVYMLSWIVLFDKFVAIRVLYSKFVGDASVGQATLFLSCLGVLCLAFLWPILLAMYLTGAEVVDWERAPWHQAVAASLLLLVYQVLSVCVVHITWKEFIGIGVALSIPVCALVDGLWKSKKLSGMKLAAFALIGVGLLLILLPENWTDLVVKPFKARKKHARRQSNANSANHTLRSRLNRTTYM